MTDVQGPSGGVSPYGEGGRSGDGVPLSPGPQPSTESPSHEVPPAAYGPAPVVRATQRPSGPPGKPRSIGVAILLEIVTIGIYGLFWVYWTQKEIKDHSGLGVGGLIGLLLYFFLSPVTFFLVPNDVGEMRAAAGRPPGVSALWGLWVLLPLFGPVIWFVKVQGLLNDYWESRGAAH